MYENDDNAVLASLRKATAGDAYNGKLWLVGGYVRDKILGLPQKQDIDIVLESDAVALAHFLHKVGITTHPPVVYPRFGTAMVTIAGQNVELITARRESYDDDSRKPATVTPASLIDDAARRDFTINALIENLHTGEIQDLLGRGRRDLSAGIIQTPLDPARTFADDPLRMLRAVRFAVRLNFRIEDKTWSAISANANRLGPPRVSFERIRDEFGKILMSGIPSSGLNMLRDSGLLAQFAPELVEMVGVTQNEFHAHAVWDHVMLALDNLVAVEPLTGLNLRLAVLLHDVAKPRTRTVGKDGRVHFYGHEDVGAEVANKLLARLKFGGADIAEVVRMVAQHMRIGEYKPAKWSDAAVRRFVRSAGPALDELFTIHRADVSALAPDHQDLSRALQLRERIDSLETVQRSTTIDSPLTGGQIMSILGEGPGPTVGLIKTWLTNEVIEGHISLGDQSKAEKLVRSGVWREASSDKT